jgi:hypothetical protein
MPFLLFSFLYHLILCIIPLLSLCMYVYIYIYIYIYNVYPLPNILLCVTLSMLQYISQLHPRTLIIDICYTHKNQFQSPSLFSLHLLHTYTFYISACKHPFWSLIFNVFFHVSKHKLPVFTFPCWHTRP